MMWDRGQSIDTRISHVPAAHQNGGKPNLNFCRYKNISKLVSAAWQSFDFIYSDMIEHHREQENLYYVQYILIAKSPSITSCCQSNWNFPFDFNCAAQLNEISRAKMLSILYLLHQCHVICIRIQLLFYYFVYSISLLSAFIDYTCWASHLHII